MGELFADLRQTHRGGTEFVGSRAHELVWPTPIRPGETLPAVDGGPMLSRISTGSEEAYGVSLAGPVLALQHAWELWDERRVASPRS